MAQPLIIPTQFTAYNGVSPVITQINTSMTSLIAHSNAVNQSVGQLPSVFSDTTKQMLEFAKSALVLGGLAIAGKSLLDYETAVQSFRTIVSDLNDADFSKFKGAIKDVANETLRSSVDIASAFATIAGLNEKFAATTEGMKQVTKASATLAMAASMELQPAAESLVGIMNQFNFAADQADRTINAMAAGQAYGAASIQNTAMALTNFGQSAYQSNVSVEQSVALVQVLAKFGQLGADAGDKLRTSFIRIKQAGVGYQSGLFNINDALSEMKMQYEKLGSAQLKDAYLADKFGATQITTGQILLGNIPLFDEFTKKTIGTSEAYKAAAIMANTLTVGLTQMKDKFITLITTSKTSERVLNILKNTTKLLTDNMGKILKVGGFIIGIWATMKTYTLALRASILLMAGAQWALNAAQFVGVLLNGNINKSLVIQAAGTKAAAAGIYVMEAAQWAWNAAMAANPIGLIIVGLAAMAALLVVTSDRVKGFGEVWAATIDFSKNYFNMWINGMKLQFLVFKESFFVTIDAIKVAWWSLQNTLGLMTDLKYANNLNEVAKLHEARLKNIKATGIDLAGNVKSTWESGGKLVDAGSKLSFKSDAEMNAEDAAKTSIKNNTSSTTNNYNQSGEMPKIVIENNTDSMLSARYDSGYKFGK